MRSIDLINTATEAAAGKWPDVLESLGITVPSNPSKHTPCPACNGKDRFRFDDHGRGSHICNQCGAGDGLDLIKKVKQCNPIEAARLVINALNIDTNGRGNPASQGKTISVERQKAKATEQNGRREKFNTNYKNLIDKAVEGEALYLAGKELTGFTFPVLPDGRLLVKLIDEQGDTAAAQTTSRNGEKRLVSGSTKRGAYHEHFQFCAFSRIFL